MDSGRSLPQALFLDLDDTIVADSESADECWRIVCERYSGGLLGTGAEKLYAALLRRRDWYWSDPLRHQAGRVDMRGARREIVARTFADEGIDNPELALLIADDYTEERHRRVHPFPGAIETLEELARRALPMALLTNGDSRYQRSKIARFGLEKYFRCIVVESEFGVGKPDEKVFRHALSSLQRQPEEVWMVGDNLTFDIAPAQMLGMFGIWVDHRRRGLPKSSTCLPGRTIQSIAELIPG